jgi:hypothetical protein
MHTGRHYLEYDPVALAVLFLGVGVVRGAVQGRRSPEFHTLGLRCGCAVTRTGEDEAAFELGQCIQKI